VKGEPLKKLNKTLQVIQQTNLCYLLKDRLELNILIGLLEFKGEFKAAGKLDRLNNWLEDITTAIVKDDQDNENSHS